MRRDLGRRRVTEYDILVIGAGIQGACVAWDAALRGLQASPSSSATTSAPRRRPTACGSSTGACAISSRGDFPRMRESIHERSALLRIAPGLVEPLRVAIPSGIQGYPGRASLRFALVLNDLLSADRNRHLDPARQLPPGGALSAGELRTLCPGLGTLARAGGAVWYDAIVSRPVHLTRAFVRSATEHGGVAVNNACAESFTSGEVGSSQWQSRIVKPEPLRKLRPGSLSWLQDRGLMRCWRAQRARSRHLGWYQGCLGAQPGGRAQARPGSGRPAE